MTRTKSTIVHPADPKATATFISRLRHSGLRVTDRKGGSANRLAPVGTALFFAKLDRH